MTSVGCFANCRLSKSSFNFRSCDIPVNDGCYDKRQIPRENHRSIGNEVMVSNTIPKSEKSHSDQKQTP